MKPTISILAVSMVLVPLTVKAKEHLSRKISKDATSSDSRFKDSVNDTQGIYSRLVEYLQKKGADDKLDDMTTASNLGFTTEMPVKTVIAIDTPHSFKGWQHHECAVVYSNGNPTSGTRNPTCIVVYQNKAQGHESTGYWFRLNLNGQLERAILSTGKNDESGNPIPGSGTQTEQDIASADVKKAYAAEMSYWTKDWLKQQQKAAVKNGKTAGK
ncbi:MAG: hypothetical protein KGJ84_09850 [Elusimicrobia bacterium]|nr:hypothetical protein [Elusimicrobiota bacterium]